MRVLVIQISTCLQRQTICINLFKRLLPLALCFINLDNIKGICSFNPQDSCIDKIKPQLIINTGNCTPAVFNNLSKSCTGYILITASAKDNETPEDQIKFDYKIDLYNDGQGAFNGYDFIISTLSKRQFKNGEVPKFYYNPFADDNKNPMDASGNYPIGTHKICWNVIDSCSNFTNICQLFEIRDCNAPIPVCKTGQQVFEMPSSGEIHFLASNFNLASFDNCSSSDKLRYFFNGNYQDTVRSISCDDFIANGICKEYFTETQLWIQDEEGNADYCKILLKINDPSWICPLTPGLSIYCQVTSVLNEKVSVISKNIETDLFINSNLKGIFYENPVRIDCIDKLSYSIESKKSDEFLNAVNTLDLYLIEKHLYKIDTFNNKYQFATGDVNQNGQVELSDYKEIKDAVLREIDQFGQSRSWKNLVVEYDKTPVFTLKERFEFKPVKHLTFIQLRSFKMGDVNDFVTPLHYIPLIAHISDSLTFRYNNKSITKGEKFIISFYAKQFRDLVGFQGTISFDSSKFRYLNVFPSTLLVDEHCIGKRFADNGKLSISWNERHPFTTSADSILFGLEFEALEDGDLCEALTFTNDLTPMEAYTDSRIIKNITLESCDILINNKQRTNNHIKIYPNPITNILKLEFPDEWMFPVRIKFYSYDGKLIEDKLIYNKTNIFIHNPESLSAGIYFVNVFNDQNSLCLKFVKN